MKKQILFASHCLEIGGAESSLIGFMHALSLRSDVETDLFLYRHTGELMSYIPQGINFLPQKSAYSCLAAPIKNVIKKGRFDVAFGRFIGKQKAKKYVTLNKQSAQKSAVGLEYSHKYTKTFMPRISDKQYDLAVSFLTPHYFVAEKVNAKKKIAFIHTDYSYVSIDVDSELKMWSAYDHIAAVSESVKNGFIKLFPSLEDKVTVIENVIPKALISTRANEFLPSEEMPNNDRIKILSIGRFCDAKNFESIPYKMKLLKSKGVNAVWYIIGYGDDSLIKKAIFETHTENDVIILGKKTNPYPYIKRCDIYAQPSRYEGKAVTVLEAQMLSKPVIISNYSTAASQLDNGVDGIIAPMDDEGFVDVLYSLISKDALRSSIVDRCAVNDYSNSKMVQKLIDLI